MKKTCHIFLFIYLFSFCATAQEPLPYKTAGTEMVFIADTQEPMLLETILHKPNKNSKATADIFTEILQRKPQSLYMLGDVVSLGHSNKKWKHIDKFLDTCRSSGTDVCGILGNHEVMIRKKKGEKNFAKRFPVSVRTGYVSVTDSVAVILLNSNFKGLSATAINKQHAWYQSILSSLDAADSIRAVIVTCHHTPYSNSKVVGGSKKVQQYFIPAYLKSKKAQLFIAGHAHAFEHFNIQGKTFVVIGGGGGLHQQLSNSPKNLPDLAPGYKPMFHYLTVQRLEEKLIVTSHYLKKDFSGFQSGHTFQTSNPLPGESLTQTDLSIQK